MQARSRWGEAVFRTLMTYPTPQLQAQAIETMILQTVVEVVRAQVKDEIAQSACEGLHPDRPARGVKCLTCYETESGLLNSELQEQPKPAPSASPAGTAEAAPEPPLEPALWAEPIED